MSNTRHDFEVLGAVRPEIQSQLTGHVFAKTDGANEQATVLLDAGDSSFESARIGSVLEQGRTLVVIDPCDDSSELLMKLTGVRASGARAIAISRDTDGQYHLGTLGSATMKESATVSEQGPPEPAPHLLENAAPEPLGAGIANLVDGLAKSAAAPLLSSGASSLIGPPGSASGEVHFYQQFGDTLGPVADNFPRAKGKVQTFNSYCDNTFYVYYADGASPPYYVVILKQQLNFGAGDLMINQECNRGCGMYQATSDVREVKVDSGVIQLVYSSPDSASEGVIAKVHEEMRQRQRTSGGMSVLTTEVQDGTQLSFADWTVIKRSDHGPTSASWKFVQNNVRNGLGDITETLFDGQTVKPYSMIGTTSLSATTYAVWRISGNARPIVNLGLEIGQNFMLIANGGCRNVDYRGGDLISRGSGLGRYNLDLAAITKASV